MSAQERSNIISRVEETQWGKPGGIGPVGETEDTHPTEGDQEYLLPVAGPYTPSEERQLHFQHPDSLE